MFAIGRRHGGFLNQHVHSRALVRPAQHSMVARSGRLSVRTDPSSNLKPGLNPALPLNASLGTQLASRLLTRKPYV